MQRSTDRPAPGATRAARIERYRDRALADPAGNALLLINPHTSFYFRSEAQVTSDEGLNAYGASTWGQFFVYQGFNQHVGWMHSSSGVDSVDEFAETVEHRGKTSCYRYGSACRTVGVRPVTIRYRTADGRLASRSLHDLAHAPRADRPRGRAAAGLLSR